jgi:hypothetical protein
MRKAVWDKLQWAVHLQQLGQQELAQESVGRHRVGVRRAAPSAWGVVAPLQSLMQEPVAQALLRAMVEAVRVAQVQLERGMLEVAARAVIQVCTHRHRETS